MHETAKVKSCNFLEYIFPPITSPTVTDGTLCEIPWKWDSFSPLRTERILADPTESAVVFFGSVTSWYFIWMHIALSTDAKAITQSAQSELAKSAKAARWATSKKWKVRKKTKYISYFVLNGLRYYRLYTSKGSVSLWQLFKVIEGQKCMNIIDMELLHKFSTFIFAWDICTVLYNTSQHTVCMVRSVEKTVRQYYI